MAGTAGLLFILAACSNNSSSYPEEYVGFEKATKNYSFDKNKDTEEFDVKIIAAEKKNEDREVLINGINMPGKAAIFSIENKTVIIPAKKKSANLRVKIYPKRVTDKAEFRIVCTPKDKEGKKTQITIHLKSPIMGTTTPFCFILPLAFSHVSLVHKCLKAV